ncbi:stalk domain-containing protein [Dehalobacterium formicoaceticum]|uniref:Stalk domain-containing protein n=1 Tax=Dehalobacterium formicoaceticum TaxID=51515 RepID=A0ABT1Y3Q9_9FIRM|nr:stalk domain-containing protein [Dehalobacterium formicoaceticum]MCR6545504.1 stalk domain-containing protein [Dehalobacterium formicoaceticum]
MRNFLLIFFSVLVFSAALVIPNVQTCLAQVEVTIAENQNAPFIKKEIFKEDDWVPVRWLFQQYVDSVDWENDRKVAVVKNDGKELIFNFSRQEIAVKENQFLVPIGYSKFINGRVFIDGAWIGSIFDMYATTGQDKDKDDIRNKLDFLPITGIDNLYSPKDGILHLTIFLDKK